MPTTRFHAFAIPFALLLSAGTSSAQTSPLGHYRYCPPGIDDAAGIESCINASSVPEDGKLYPLGQDLFVTPAGRIGFGTKSPSARLDVVGTGGFDSVLRLESTGSVAGGILLQRSGGVPADWTISYDTAPNRRDFLIRDNLAADVRMRINASGTVMVDELHVGNASGGLQFSPAGASIGINYGAPGTNPSTFMTAHPDEIECSRLVTMSAGAELGAFGTLQFTEDDFFGASPPMIYMFKDGSSNSDRMVLSHSEAYEEWGLRYDDDIDSFHFLAGGSGVMTVKLRTGTAGMVGIGDSTPSNILQIRQGSSTDPIADAWTTYSSRRWKENIEPIEDALDLVRALRGVTFDWKESGEHDLGMIAEEVGTVVPEVVAFEENGIDAQSIDYARLTALLVEAVKEQDAQIAVLVARLDALEAR